MRVVSDFGKYNLSNVFYKRGGGIMTTYEAMSIMIMLLMLILEIIDNKSQKK